MSNRKWDEFGEEIRKIVQDAVEHQDYGKLSETINRTVSKAVETVKRGAYGEASPYHYSQKRQPVDWSSLVHTPSKTGAVLSAVFGIILGSNFLLGAFGMLLGALLGFIDLGFALVMLVAALFTGALGAGGITIGIRGIKKLQRIDRLKKYTKAIGGKEYCNVSVLACKVGKPDDTVVKDLEYMIKNRWFAQGHLDKDKTCFMLTDQMYQQYMQLERQKQAQVTAQKYTSEPAPEKKTEAKEPAEQKKEVSELEKVIAKGEAYLVQIRKCNDDIPGEEISAKISRIETLVAKIFDRITKNPENLPDIRKMMEYYLPTTVKLLEAYAQMDAQPVGGENIVTAKKEIEATLDTLNVAFEKLLDSLFQDTAWDISSDISVLNTMLAQEGLTEDGLKKK